MKLLEVPPRLVNNFLEVSQRNTDLAGNLTRTEIWVGKAILNDIAYALEHPFRIKGTWYWVHRREHCSEQIINRRLHIVASRCWHGLLVVDGVHNELE